MLKYLEGKEQIHNTKLNAVHSLAKDNVKNAILHSKLTVFQLKLWLILLIFINGRVIIKSLVDPNSAKQLTYSVS